MNILAIAGLLLASMTVAAADDLRLASIREIRTAAPVIKSSDVQILGTPPLRAPLEKVMLRRATYHPETKQWEMQLQCIPQRACLPFVAVIHTLDASLFPRRYVPHATALLVRAGDRKEMASTFGAVRLRQYVICLQPGRAGDSIRVRPEGENRVRLATVSPDGSLIARGTK